VRRTSDADIAHLEQFARSRRGVEAYVEPRTTVTAMTVVLGAASTAGRPPVRSAAT
jgi:hypothetical protein